MESSKRDAFRKLTWADLEEWAGDTIVSRGKSYQQKRRVEELAYTPSGGIVAWVQGSEQYATLVDIEGKRPISACTCPYEDTCKHAVAVVLQYLECLKQDIELPTVTQDDERLVLLEETADGDARGQGEGARKAGRGKKEEGSFDSENAPDVLDSFLKQQTKAQLLALLEDISERYPAVRRYLQDRHDVATEATESAALLIKTVRKEIYSLSSKPGWYRKWDGEGYTPDYSHVRDRLEALLSKGHADEVVKLGEILFKRGIAQVEMSDDEGETTAEISFCMSVVFQALSKSSLSPAAQMLWAVEADLEDGYDICQGAWVLWEKEYSVKDWNTLAEELSQRLDRQKSMKDEDDFRNHHRDRLSNWLILALERAGRQEEIIPLCERETLVTGSYVRLVEYLVEADRREEAEQWIRKGCEATKKRWPGIAAKLRDILLEMREKENDWLGFAALRAEDFFERPTQQSFQQLQSAAEQAQVWPVVRAAVMRYLETGHLPRAAGRAASDRDESAWPLPEADMAVSIAVQRKHFPMIGTLIGIAVAEGRPDEVVRWYDQRRPEQFGWNWFQEDEIADFIADAYPDRALDMWKKLAERDISQAQSAAYESAAVHLQKVRRVLKQMGREGEWQSYLVQLRQANARKRRLLEILDTLAGRRIIEER